MLLRSISLLILMFDCLDLISYVLLQLVQTRSFHGAAYPPIHLKDEEQPHDLQRTLSSWIAWLATMASPVYMTC